MGVIHVVDEMTEDFDIKWITSTGPHSPYIAVLYPLSFRKDVLDRLQSSGRINGILLIHRNNSQVEEFSYDRSCPNRGYGKFKCMHRMQVLAN